MSTDSSEAPSTDVWAQRRERVKGPRVCVVMGVSGSGKTTVAAQLATVMNWPFVEGDDLHPEANVEKMRQGHPLTDEDRWPWLARIAAVIDGWRAAGSSGVLTCSALRRAYRDVLIGARTDVRLLYLRGGHDLIARRLAARHEHFMPAALLDSQFATLEEPSADEHPLVFDIDHGSSDLVAAIVDALAA